MSADKLVKEALYNVENQLKNWENRLPSRVKAPLTSGYRPELDVSPLLNDDSANYYKQLIGIL